MIPDADADGVIAEVDSHGTATLTVANGTLIEWWYYTVEVTTTMGRRMPRWSSDSQELGFLPQFFVVNVSGEPSRVCRCWRREAHASAGT